MFASALVLISVLAVVSGKNAYLADFSAAGLGDSFFQITVDGGSANYDYKLDLTNL